MLLTLQFSYLTDCLSVSSQRPKCWKEDSNKKNIKHVTLSATICYSMLSFFSLSSGVFILMSSFSVTFGNSSIYSLDAGLCFIGIDKTLRFLVCFYTKLGVPNLFALPVHMIVSHKI